ncbi:MAG TPA: tetratricopeptide repeat protein [Mucilaginibacter sp.]|nr:tetratricopeptide repeat protein [Mucilaginibacter sp.]
MTQTNKSSVKPTCFLLLVLAIMATGCTFQKQSGFNRTMQNLTAHYNILFNAKEILRQKQDAYTTAFVDNYNEILAVYQDTTPHSATVDKDLDLATVKANYLINMKDQSKYIGDAYLVLGQANYLEGNYFNAVEYFSYVIRSFPKRKDLVQQSYVWKARTLIYLDKLPDAKAAIDSAIANIDPKKNKPFADIFATKLEYDVVVMDYADGEEMAKQAIHLCHDQTQRLRWTFILSQLEELNGKMGDALKNYAQIAKSNALFEMAFNASLNIIRIQDNQNGIKVDRLQRLKELLKNPNNIDFKDQIYYNIAQLEHADKHIDPAIKDYNLSLRVSTKNQTQKGLSYLRLAEIYFDDKADYLKSKKYYDSTLTSLPVTYPGYQAIQKKGSNLAYLAERLQVITREDTLQALAKMSKGRRDSVIDKMVSDYTLQQQQAANAAKANAAAAITSTSANSFAGGSFYFDNAGAVSQGYTDFKRVWGNRKLEDDWRRSSRSSGNITNNQSGSIQANDPDAPITGSGPTGNGSSGASGYRQNLVKALPLTADLLAQSNTRIYNAYYDIANFYRDVLDDKKEAIAYFEQMLARFPNDPNRPAIYYSLYRLYSDAGDNAKAGLYKNKVIKEFPETPFAKILTDPEYFKKIEDKDAELTNAYNVIFDLYDHKAYKDVIACVPELMKQFPDNKFSAQLYYLQTIAQGHFEKLGPFKDSLQQLVKTYPGDRLATPLAKQHLTYIAANDAEMQSRNTVLADVDPKEVPFTLAEENQKKAAYRPKPRAPLPYDQAVAEKKKELQAAAAKTPDKQQQAVVAPIVLPAQPGKKDSVSLPVTKHPYISAVFNMADSANYYFVINVATGTTNMSSSRFGIGQFNRANFTGQQLRHQLLAVGDNNQLVYVGMFSSLNAVKKYAQQIVPLLGDIMKVPVDKYSYFIITKQNLDKLADKKTLDSYIDYYQNNY